MPGYHWLQVLIADPRGAPRLAHIRWWSTRGEGATEKRTQEEQVLQKVARLWDLSVIHIWDRGFAGAPWVLTALQYRVRFVLRWRKDYKLIGPKGIPQKPWQIVAGKRAWGYRELSDARRRCYRKVGVVAAPVHLPDDNTPLWLVVTRFGPGRKPWYLLTTETISTEEDAWRVALAYARRWQVELSIRFTKSDLAFECPRLHAWEERLKFLLIATLAYAFFLALLKYGKTLALTWLLDTWCHRTGKRSRKPAAPLSRLRLALIRLWLDFRPSILPRLNSG